MSDNEQNGAAAGGEISVEGMPAADVKFLVTCLKYTTGGSVQIDNNKVAEVLGYKNPRSVQNKVTAMKKKYDLPLGGSGKASAAGTPNGKTPASSKKASEAAGPNNPVIPKTPSKTGRVTKPRATSSTKKKATPKSKAKAESADEDMKVEHTDEEADSKAAYEAVFGKVEEDEDEDNEDEEHENESENEV